MTPRHPARRGDKNYVRPEQSIQSTHHGSAGDMHKAAQGGRPFPRTGAHRSTTSVWAKLFGGKKKGGR